MSDDIENYMDEYESELYRKLPPGNALIFFFIALTLIYGFIIIYNIMTLSSEGDVEDAISNIYKNTNSNIYTIIYIIFLITGTYFINVKISKGMCKEYSIQWGELLILTLLPWFVIFGILFFLLELFTGWIKPYSNTIGYIIVKALGIEEKIQNILEDPNSSATQVTQALINIKKNYAMFINEIDIEKNGYSNFMEQLKREGLAQDVGKDSDIIDLYKLIVVKHVIGKLFWYILAGTLIASISYNLIINMNCNKTIEDITRNKNKDKKPLNGKKWKLISETESYKYNYNAKGDIYLNKSEELLDIFKPEGDGDQRDWSDTVYITNYDSYTPPNLILYTGDFIKVEDSEYDYGYYLCTGNEIITN